MKPAHLHTGEIRGIVSVRSDTSALALVQSLNQAFDEFRATMTQRTSDQDVLLQEKEDRLQAAMSDIQAAIDAQNTDIEQLRLGTRGEPGSQVSAEVQAHQQAWAAYMRTGDGERQLDQLGLARGDLQATMINRVNAAGSVGTADKGGHLAPIEWDRTITDARVDITPMRRFASQQNVTGQGFIKLFNLHGAGSGWVGEETARGETTSPDLKAYAYSFGEIYANPSATQQLLDDAEIDFAAWLSGEV